MVVLGQGFMKLVILYGQRRCALPGDRPHRIGGTAGIQFSYDKAG
jgi:hypothetical protein